MLITTDEPEGNPRVSHVRPLLLIALAAAAVFLQWIPHQLRPFLRFDSGIFLYAGEQLRHGAVLYRDVWDHKPPLIFYLNELGLALGSGSPGGVLAIDFVLVLICFALGYLILCRLFSREISLAATLLGLFLFFDVTLHPNLGEVACLPLQAIALCLLVSDLQDGASLIRAGVQGGLIAVLFWFRPNGIAISLVYLAVTGPALFVAGGIRRVLKWSAVFVGAAAVCTLAIVVPVVIRSSWQELWFATFQFNQLYAGLATNVERAHALLWLLFQTAQHGVILLAIAGLIIIPLNRTAFSTARDRFRWSVLLWFVLEALFAAYTGKLYGKNAIPWVLPSISSTAILFDALTRSERAGHAKRGLQALSAVVSVFLILNGLSQWRDNAKRTQSPDDPVVAVIQRLTSPTDKVQFWGAFPTDTLWLAKRTSASRFFSSVPLMHGEAAYRRLAPVELTDLLRNEPKAIIERDAGQLPSLIAPNYETNSPAWDTASLAASKARLSRNYSLAWSDQRTHSRILLRH